MDGMPVLAFVRPPLPGWAWVVLIVGGIILYVFDRLRDRNRDR